MGSCSLQKCIPSCIFMFMGTEESASPVALQSPVRQLTQIDDMFFSEAVAASRKSPRGRIALRLHQQDDDPLQRMLNVLQPGSYVQPHRHHSTPRAESIILLT